MKKCITILFFTITSHTLLAHPGIGIVKDSKGNIYYTDLKQIWKIDVNGKHTIAVKDVHSHELYMDSADNLFGEHLWYNGEKADTWGHYVWCLKSDGSLVKVKEPAAGFLENYSFVRDRQGNMFWAERWKISRIKKRMADGKIITLVEGKFKDIRWMYATPSGVLYFIDLNDLYKVDNHGRLSIIAKGLEERITISEHTSLKHDIFGIWQDNADNIYIAVKGGDIVKKITADGSVSPVIYSSGGWSPTSGVFDNDGNLWLMESNTINETRVRKITKKELSIPVGKKSTGYKIPILTAAGVSLLLIAGIKMRLRNHKKLRNS